MTQQLDTRTLTVTFASADYRTGQHDARAEYARDPENAPIGSLLERYRSADYARGYVAEWERLTASALLASA